MRRNAAAIAMMALACIALPSMAKPTRLASRTAAHKLELPHAILHETRERKAAVHTRAERPQLPHSRIHTAAAKAPARGHRVPAGSTAADAETIRRVHAWEQGQRAAAARSASRAADSEPPAGASSSPRIASADDSQDSTDLSAAALLPGLPSIEEQAATPIILPRLYDERGRLIVPPPLRGSREILLHQNEMADRDGLDRVRDDADLADLRHDGKLVPLPENEALRVDERLPEDRRYSRPWTAAFLAVLARNFYASFHAPLQVDSAVRTMAFQQHLTHINGNAAPATGDTASPHLTGEAVDIAKHGLTLVEIAWMRAYLQPLIGQGKIDVEEEFQQACFHISVYRNYVPGAAPGVRVAAAAATHQLPPAVAP